MDLFDLYVKISIDDSGYNKGIANATKSGKELSQKFATSYTKGFETFAKKAAKAVKVVSKVVSGAVAALGAVGLNYNSQMESYTANFEVMLGSTEKAVAKVEELKTMAAKTPFGMEELASATQTLIAFQVPAEESTEILRMLGDVALGDKEKMSGLAIVFGQVSSAGKLQGQDLMQMINQGFNPLNYISQRTGESMEELRDRMSKGAISAEEVTQAFKDATSAGGQFYQGMEKASTTTAGLISTLKDNVNSKLGELFSFASDKLKELLPKVIDFIDKIDVQKIVDKVKLAVEWFEKWSPLILGVVAAFTSLYAAFKLMLIIPTITKAFQLLNAAFLANPIVFVVAAIAGLVTAFVTLWNTSEEFRNFWVNLWERVRSATVETWNEIKASWDEAVQDWNSLMSDISTAWDDFWEGFNKILQFISNTWDASWQHIFDFFESIWLRIVETAEHMWEAISSVWETIQQITIEVFENIKQNVVDKWNTLKENVVNIVNNIKDNISEKFTAAKSKALEIFDNIRQGISDKINAAKEFVGSVIEKIKGFFNFSWSLPHLKMPHFSIKGKFSLDPPSVPRLAVDWYALGGVLKSPTIFGVNGNRVMAGGEAGPEAVAPIDVLQGYIADAVKVQNNELSKTLAGQLAEQKKTNAALTALLDAISGGKVKMSVDGREFGRLVRANV